MEYIDNFLRIKFEVNQEVGGAFLKSSTGWKVYS